MSYIKLVNGEPVEMSDAEIAERQAEEALWLSKKAESDWQQQMKSSDSDLPRYAEDIIDALDSETKARLPDYLKTKYQNKKELRAQKPAK